MLFRDAIQFVFVDYFNRDLLLRQDMSGQFDDGEFSLA